MLNKFVMLQVKCI